MAMVSWSGVSTSPVPVTTSVSRLSATIIMAASRRRYRSVRQSLANSTAARISWSGYCSSLASSRSKSVKASAVEPAKPPITLPSASRRTFLAVCFITVWPMETWPSPATTTLLPLRTETMVVPCQPGKLVSLIGGDTPNCRMLFRSRARDCNRRTAQRKGPALPPRRSLTLRLYLLGSAGVPENPHAPSRYRPPDQRARDFRLRRSRRHRPARHAYRRGLFRPYAGPVGAPFADRHDGRMHGRRPYRLSP